MERACRLIGKMDLQVADPEMRACAAWPAAAGPKIACHTRARALVRGVLVVEVEDAVWQRQLATLQPFMLRNLAREMGQALVTGLDFRPMPARRQPQRAASARPSGPISPAQDDAAGIQDPVMALLYRQSRSAADTRRPPQSEQTPPGADPSRKPARSA
jgi:hypothetical protein